MGGLLQRLKDFYKAQQDARPWLSHAVRANAQLSNTNGSLLAGAVTFYSFVALFPLILLGVAVTGFVLSADPSLRTQLLDKISEQVPGTFGTTIKDSINNAIDAKTAVGVVALVSLLLTGLGWINNLRLATAQVWGQPPLKRSFVSAKLSDTVVLVGLGVGLIASVAVTAVGSALSGTVLRALRLDAAPGIQILTAVIGIVVAVAADMIIFVFLLVRLPKADVPRNLAIRAALLAAVGFEILKYVGTYYIARVSTTTYGALASTIGVLLWLNLVFRFLLYCTAWTATGVRGLSVAETGHAPMGVTSGAASADGATKEPSRTVAWGLVLGALVRRRK